MKQSKKKNIWGDIIKRSVVTIIGLGLLLYLATLVSSAAIIVKDQYTSFNTVAYVVIGLVVVFYMVVYGVYPIHIKWHKRTFLLVGISLILGAEAYLFDDASLGIYIEDLSKLLGVFLVVFGASGYLIPQKSQMIQQESEVEIIEA